MEIQGAISENMYFSNCSLGICFSKYCILVDGRSDSWESWKTFEHLKFFLYMRVCVIYIYIYNHSLLPILLISYLQQDQDWAKFLCLVFRRNSLLREFSPSLPSPPPPLGQSFWRSVCGGDNGGEDGASELKCFFLCRKEGILLELLLPLQLSFVISISSYIFC